MIEWQEIQTRHGAALKRIVASYAPVGPARDDLAQEVATAIFTALPRFRGDASLRTYVFRIAHNVGLRAATRRRANHAEVFEDAASEARGPEELAVARQRREHLLDAVRQLPLGQRQAVTLALEGLSHAEIADVLGIRENTVSVRLHRARNHLSLLLERP